MYTQSFNVQETPGQKKATPVASLENPEAQARFDAQANALAVGQQVVKKMAYLVAFQGAGGQRQGQRNWARAWVGHPLACIHKPMAPGGADAPSTDPLPVHPDSQAGH